jgi:hypothetical protein
VKFAPKLPWRRRDGEEPRSPSHLFGGRVRTSTVALIVAFFAVWWLYGAYRTDNKPPPAKTTPPAQVVPPGFVPDPDYTWVPRTQVQPQRPRVEPTPTSTPPPPPPPPPPTTTTPPPIVLPTLPCIPPFCTPPPQPSNTPLQPPQPGPGPTPTSAPPVR